MGFSDETATSRQYATMPTAARSASCISLSKVSLSLRRNRLRNLISVRIGRVLRQAASPALFRQEQPIEVRAELVRCFQTTGEGLAASRAFPLPQAIASNDQ